MTRRARSLTLTVVASAVLAAGVTGCSGSTPNPGTSSALPEPSMSRSPSSTPSPSASAEPTDTTPPGTRQEVAVAGTVASDLAVPWGVAFIPTGGGAALVAERDSGRILRISSEGRATVLGTVPGVQHGGEGGLLGLAVDETSPGRVYAYLTSVQGDNRIVRMTYSRSDLGAPRTIFTGIPSGAIHNGGRIVFGPDGNLYVGTGEAGLRDPAQDQGSLGGKILRITPSGEVPDDNPFRGSPVWSLGHRNVQGLAFDSSGRLWASEFGQNTWDELNRIRKGGNYGWPVVEGKANRSPYIDPLVVWHPEVASPSGLAIVNDVAYLAALRGARLWQVPLVGSHRGDAKALLVDRYGRLRSLAVTADGDLWLTTSNRDGRGSPAASDDRILRLTLS